MTILLPQPGRLTTEEVATLREENIRTYGTATAEPLDSPSAHRPTEGGAAMNSPAGEPDRVVYVRNAPNGQKSLTMGVVAVCLFWLPLVNVIFGVLAFIYGQDGYKSEDHDVRVKSIAGMILGGIGGFWWVAVMMLMAAGNGG